MTHEEEEAMQHDISKIRDQVQQNSLSQKVTEVKMDGLKKYVEVKMDGLKKGVEAKMEDLKIYLKNFLQEMLTNGKRVVRKIMMRKK